MGAAGLASLAPRFSAGAPDRGERPSAPDRPNIIFVLTDDQTLRGLSCYGSTLMETPNLDRIAEEGMRFDKCFRDQLPLRPESGLDADGQVQPRAWDDGEHFPR